MDDTRGQFFCEGMDLSALGEAGAHCQPIEDHFAEKAARLQAILDTTVDGIVTIDEQRIILSFNRAAERIFGYKADEVIGKNVTILQPSPYREHHDEYVLNYLRTGVRKIIGIGREVEGRRKDGSTFPLYLAVSEVRVGRRRYFSGILRDLTEEKKTLEEVRSLARFPEESPHPVMRVSRAGELLYANGASRCLLAVWGSGPGQILPDPLRTTVIETFESDTERELEVQCGQSVYALTLVPVPNAKDINVYGKDITKRKRVEEALRSSEEEHRTLVQSSSDAILLVDKDRKILSFNRAFLELFGFRKKEEIEGQSTRILHRTDESFSEFGRQARPAVEARGFFRTEWELCRKDGTPFFAEETFSPVRDRGGSVLGFVAIIRDVTKRKRAEEKLREYGERLEEMVIERTRELEEAYKILLQEEKLKTLGTISAEMAHEIRNPLMAIGGFARRLQKRMPDEPEIKIIMRESGRLEEILKRIEYYLKPVELRPRESSVNAIIEEALGFLAPEVNRQGVDLHLNLTPNLPSAYVDPGVLIQVIVNVVHNAIKVMREDGKISIQTLETDQNVRIFVRAPLKVKINNPEHVFIPFGENSEEISVPVCFRLLQGMGGKLSMVQEEDSVVFAASLLKAVHKAGE